MKIIKAKIYYTKDKKGTHYSGGYPKTWEAEKIPFILYGDTDVDTNGKNIQWVFTIVPEDIYDKMIQDEQCQFCSKEESLAMGDKYYSTREKITDNEKILKILAKTAREEILTEDEKNALNPDHPESGVNKSKSFEDICNEYGVQF